MFQGRPVFFYLNPITFFEYNSKYSKEVRYQADKLVSEGCLSPSEEELFKDQHISGSYSGFMVGPDLIATAGHCGETESDVQKTAYIFGFEVLSSDDHRTTSILSEQVCFGKELKEA